MICGGLVCISGQLSESFAACLYEVLLLMESRHGDEDLVDDVCWDYLTLKAMQIRSPALLSGAVQCGRKLGNSTTIPAFGVISRVC